MMLMLPGKQETQPQAGFSVSYQRAGTVYQYSSWRRSVRIFQCCTRYVVLLSTQCVVPGKVYTRYYWQSSAQLVWRMYTSTTELLQICMFYMAPKGDQGARWVSFCTWWAGAGCQTGWTHCRVEVPHGNNRVSGNKIKNTWKSQQPSTYVHVLRRRASGSASSSVGSITGGHN